MLKIAVFIFLTISFMLIFGKIIELVKTTINILKERKFIQKLLSSRTEKAEEKRKSTLKERFEAKGWRVAK